MNGHLAEVHVDAITTKQGQIVHAAFPEGANVIRGARVDVYNVDTGTLAPYLSMVSR